MVKRVLSALWRALPKPLRRVAVRLVAPHFTVGTVVVVADDEHRVLLLEHVFRSGSGWGLPGGFLAKREQPEAAIRRELREEVGLELDALEIVCVRTAALINQVEIVFRAKPVGEPRPRGLEIASLGWFGPHEWPTGLGIEQRRLIDRALGRDGGA